MKIRRATQYDTDAIVDMGAQFYATTSYASFAPYDETSAAVLVQMMRDSGILLVAENEDGRVIGMVGLVVVGFHFNQSVRTAHEVMWWVEPRHRDTGAGLSLLRAVDDACVEQGVTAAQMMTLATSPPQAALLYERLGYTHSETSYTKVV